MAGAAGGARPTMGDGTEDGLWHGVPCLDLDAIEQGSAAEREAAVRVLCDGFIRFGFVRLQGHGIAPALLDRVDRAFRAFFDAPEAVRERCAGVEGGQRGYTPFGLEHAKDRDRPDLKAFFHVGQPAPEGPEAGRLPANVFPDGDVELKRAALALFDGLERASVTVLRGVEHGFGLPTGALADMVRGGNSILRALDYPPLEAALFAREAEAEGEGFAVRAAPHEDINLVTLLPVAHEEGLEIHLPDVAPGDIGGWRSVGGEPGEIIADVGDMLERVTGGRLPATTHRVVVRADQATRRRTAYPFFAHPRPECDLSVRAEFVPPSGTPPYPPITAGAFLAERLAEIGLVEAD